MCHGNTQKQMEMEMEMETVCVYSKLKRMEVDDRKILGIKVNCMKMPLRDGMFEIFSTKLDDV